MNRRSAVAAWLAFAAAVLLPSMLVAVIAWRARGASIVEAQREEDARVAAAAAAAKRELDGRVADARKVVRALPEQAYPLIATPPPGSDAIVLDEKDQLVVPPPPAADAKTSDDCQQWRDELVGPQRVAARDHILATCIDLKSASGRYLWPLLATETSAASALPDWLRAHADRLGADERDVLRRRFASIDEKDRARALEALSAPPSAHVTLRGALAAKGDETADGPLRIREGSSIIVLRTVAGGVTGGVVFHERSILRDPPSLPADLALQAGAGAPSANVSVAPSLVFHVEPRDAAAASAARARNGNVLFALAIAAVIASVVLSAILYARFQSARRLAELRTDFVAAVSHELRTPLASVQMLAELLEDGSVPEDERAEVEKTLATEARRLAATLSRMLRFGALSRGKLAVEKKRVPLLPIAEEAAARLTALHPALKVEVHVDDGLEADVDAGLLALALDNLLGNAAKYAPEGHPYQLGMRLVERKLVISVADSGPGLDRRAQAKIFLPFERADDRLSRATEGTGVGLALVRGIAQAHDGDARVESAPGKGATFFLEIPWKPS